MFWFSLQLFFWNTSHSKKNWPRCDQKCILVFVWSTRFCCSTLIKLEFSQYIFDNYRNIEFHENPSGGSRVVPCGQERRTDMTMLRVAFRNFAKPPKKWHWNKFCFEFRFCSCQSQSTNALYSPPSTCCSYQKDEQTKPGNLPKSYGLSESGSIG